MKKGTTTLPSTKADHLYSSQNSQASLHKRPTYQQQLSLLLSSLKATHHLRYSILFRDLQPIFSSNEALLSDLLKVRSTEQLWQLLGGLGKEQLREQQQVALLLRLMLELNSRKHLQAEKGNIIAFQQLKNTIEWFIPQIVAYEAAIRHKLEQQLLETCENQKQCRLAEFRRYEFHMKEEFEALEQIRKEGLGQRLHREAELKITDVVEKIQRDMHKIRASSQMRDAKETVLLRKLAPYRWDKKRAYEDTTYRADLQRTLELDQSRRTRAIEHLKRVEKEKLRRAHETLISTQEMYAETQRERLHLQLTSQAKALYGHQEQALRNLRHSVDVTNNHRVSSLRKSLQAFSKHEDTLKIKQILQDHHNKVQFCNIIEDAVQPQARVHGLETPYRTLQTDRAGSKLEEAADRHQRRLKKRLNELLGSSQLRDQQPGRKSLVDLYDKSLNLVQQL